MWSRVMWTGMTFLNKIVKIAPTGGESWENVRKIWRFSDRRLTVSNFPRRLSNFKQFKHKLVQVGYSGYTIVLKIFPKISSGFWEQNPGKLENFQKMVPHFLDKAYNLKQNKNTSTEEGWDGYSNLQKFSRNIYWGLRNKFRKFSISAAFTSHSVAMA